MYCPNCGKSLPDQFIFCDSCGTRIEKLIGPEQPAESAVGTQNEIPQESHNETTYEPPRDIHPEPAVTDWSPASPVTPHPATAAQNETPTAQTMTAASPPPSTQVFLQAQSMQPEFDLQADKVPADDRNNSKTVSFLTWMIINILNIIPFSFSLLFIVTIFGRNIYLISEGEFDLLSIILMVLAAAYIVLILIWAIGSPRARSLKNFALATIVTALAAGIAIVAWLIIDPEFVKFVFNAFLYYFDIPYEIN